MRNLLQGVQSFQQHVYPGMRSRFEELAHGQQPEALFITCSDSRIEPARLTDCGPGELFVIRNAGNIVGRKRQADLGVAATIEYAIKALQVPQIIVCGHSKCGAMQGLLHPEAAAGLPEVGRWVTLAEDALNDNDVDPRDDRLTQVIKANIRLQLRNLLTFPEVAEAVEAGKLRLSGWLYDFPTGGLAVLSPETNKFIEPQLGSV